MTDSPVASRAVADRRYGRDEERERGPPVAAVDVLDGTLVL
jgi:hypothetical protein